VLDTKLTDEAGRLRALHRYGVLDGNSCPQFDKITALVRDLLNVPICAVSLIDEGRQVYKSMVGFDVGETSRDVAFCDHTIRTREVMVVEDATDDDRFLANPLVTGEPNIRSYAGAPLVTPDGYNLGALCAIDSRPRDFDTGDRALLKKFSALIVDQLELNRLAFRDFLTGALSRRAFTEATEAALGQLARDGSGAALLSFDLDHFKKINDVFGHPEGDRVLSAVAAECRAIIRPGDSFGRLGGEEFAVLLPGSGMDEAEACAERLRAAIEAIPAERCRPVTASFGIACAPPATTMADWFTAVDAALYAAKRRGRNCCVPSAILSAAA
jgi:diguanylate cyclase (GGDEF)-like protein